VRADRLSELEHLEKLRRVLYKTAERLSREERDLGGQRETFTTGSPIRDTIRSRENVRHVVPEYGQRIMHILERDTSLTRDR